MKANSARAIGLAALIGLIAGSQCSFAATALVNKQFRRASIHVTPQGPVYLYPDAATAANNISTNCIRSRWRPC